MEQAGGWRITSTDTMRENSKIAPSPEVTFSSNGRKPREKSAIDCCYCCRSKHTGVIRQALGVYGRDQRIDEALDIPSLRPCTQLRQAMMPVSRSAARSCRRAVVPVVPVVPLGDTLGFLPGPLDEKIASLVEPDFRCPRAAHDTIRPCQSQQETAQAKLLRNLPRQAPHRLM